jgi:hypothetical protein
VVSGRAQVVFDFFPKSANLGNFSRAVVDRILLSFFERRSFKL